MRSCNTALSLRTTTSVGLGWACPASGNSVTPTTHKPGRREQARQALTEASSIKKRMEQAKKGKRKGKTEKLGKKRAIDRVCRMDYP